MIYNAIGLMSGSSLDGLDIAYARLEWAEGSIKKWELLAAETLPFSDMWQARLLHLPQQDALSFAKTHVYFGHYMAELVQGFRQQYPQLPKPDFIASHGHTIFHQPQRRYSIQIGDGAALAALTQCRVVCDFRSQDVALDGEGAPLAPLADKYLFSGYDFYLNIGGIANISTNIGGKLLGFDVCAANQLLNVLAQQLGANYDEDGAWARKGVVLPELLAQASRFDFHRQPPPKSLGNEWIRQHLIPLFIQDTADAYDKLATATEYIATELAAAVKMQLATAPKAPVYRMLATGGGVFNAYLVERIAALLAPHHTQIILPEKNIIQFKEALLMALLGLLRLEGQSNSYSSITGAKRDTVNGAVYY